MLIFTKIRWCNFLSTGNSFTEVCLNDSPNVLIIGENGAGKSTILDALCFALFGKAFRNINKPQLLNSVNQKGLITEIEFTINNKNYKVIRGIKPNIFEIWCDGICLNQDSATKDYQEHLEKFILKMTFKSFTQIVILGSASFKPFMQLTPAERRIIIEDLLDIQIFSVMNTIVKQRFIMNRELIEKNRIEHIGKTEKITVIEKTLKGLKQNNENRLKQLQEQYDELEKTKIILFDEISSHEKTLTALIEKTQPLAKRKTKFNEAIKIKTKLITNADRCETNIKFYSNNDICPTCKQNLESHFIENQLTELTTKKTEYTKAISDITKKLDAITSEIELSEKHISEANDIRLHITAKTTQYNNIINQMNNINETIQELKCSDQLTIDNEEELKNAQTEIERIKVDRERLIEEKTIIETGIQLLKDGGIKTKIIKQYLPIINKLINKYLSEMGFFVNFNIDENFNETIKSRYRDVFSYQNFSEGEKTRIDLALLFTWRAIARMRNSINTNLLLFDEIFDGSLDANGTDEFLKIMWNFNENANIFVISHKQDVLIDKFKKVYRFKKTKNFSVLV